MTAQAMIETEYASLWYYPQSKIIHHEFHKYIHGDALRQHLQQGLAILAQQGVQKWLSDDRKNSALPQADIDWAEQNWMIPMIQAGWKYWAVVLPDKTVGQANMLRIIEPYIKNGVQVQTFDSPASALQWLESVK